MESYEASGGRFAPGSPELMKALADRAKQTALRKAALKSVLDWH